MRAAHGGNDAEAAESSEEEGAAGKEAAAAARTKDGAPAGPAATTDTKEQPQQQQQPQQQPLPVPSSGCRNSKQLEHFARIRETVRRAITAKHTFMIHGRSRVVRECLLARGWCEKFQRKVVTGPEGQQIGIDSSPSVLLAGIGDLSDKQNERVLISKMLTKHTVDFLWNAGSEWAGWPSQDNKSTLFNRFSRANFTSKVGLCSNVRQMHWYYEAGIANTLFPRCYNMSQSDQVHAFIDDYRLTACMSLLKWLLDGVKCGGEDAVRGISGVVPLRALDFAVGRCSDFIGSKSHEDLDQELERVWAHQWEQFISWYYKLIHGHALLVSSNVPLHKYLLASRHLLNKLRKYWPQLDMDGIMNVWILKPGNKSRGRGIMLLNKLDDILAKVSPTNKGSDTRFVVQKYIERPLLIYDTKFDIRQWFVITNAQPLTIWMYRESYLRFCSQKFSLTDFHESIHLSNNAVQCKYKNSPERDSSLPSDNMWDVAAFKDYLKARGHDDAWDKLIYPGIKQGLVGSLLASQEAMDRRKNSFELYGADFMVMEDFSVWLIEINSHPDMSSSTSVTTRLCRKAMEDIIKVVVDYRENSTADTGDFELVYKQKVSPCQNYLGSGLSLQGIRIAVAEKRSMGGPVISCSAGKRKTPALGPEMNSHVGPVLVDLIEELELQLDREFQEYLRLRSSSALARKPLPLPEGNHGRDDSRRQSIETNTQPVAGLGAVTAPLPAASQSASCKSTANKSPMLALKNTAGKFTRNSAKFVSRRIIKQKNNTTREKHIESTPSTQQATKALVTKIMDLQNDPDASKTAATSHIKLQRFIKTFENQPEAEEGSSTKEQKPMDKYRMVSTKVIPTIPSKLITLSKKKDAKAPRSAYESSKAMHHARKRTRAMTSQVFVDVTDMYAVGLAVNNK